MLRREWERDRKREANRRLFRVFAILFITLATLTYPSPSKESIFERNLSDSGVSSLPGLQRFAEQLKDAPPESLEDIYRAIKRALGFVPSDNSSVWNAKGQVLIHPKPMIDGALQELRPICSNGKIDVSRKKKIITEKVSEICDNIGIWMRAANTSLIKCKHRLCKSAYSFKTALALSYAHRAEFYPNASSLPVNFSAAKIFSGRVEGLKEVAPSMLQNPEARRAAIMELQEFSEKEIGRRHETETFGARRRRDGNEPNHTSSTKSVFMASFENYASEKLSQETGKSNEGDREKERLLHEAISKRLDLRQKWEDYDFTLTRAISDAKAIESSLKKSETVFGEQFEGTKEKLTSFIEHWVQDNERSNALALLNTADSINLPKSSGRHPENSGDPIDIDVAGEESIPSLLNLYFHKADDGGGNLTRNHVNLSASLEEFFEHRKKNQNNASIESLSNAGAEVVKEFFDRIKVYPKDLDRMVKGEESLSNSSDTGRKMQQQVSRNGSEPIREISDEVKDGGTSDLEAENMFLEALHMTEQQADMSFEAVQLGDAGNDNVAQRRGRNDLDQSAPQDVRDTFVD